MNRLATILFHCILLLFVSRAAKPKTDQDRNDVVRIIKTHADERSYREKLNRRAWVSNALWSATTIFTAAAAGFACWGAVEGLRQADAAEEGNRPWIQVTGNREHTAINGPGNIMKEGETLYLFNIKVKNVGKTPARRVRATGILFRTTNLVLREDMCAVGSQIMYQSSTRFLFPDLETEIEFRPLNNMKLEPLKSKYPYGEYTLLSGCVTYLDTKGTQHRSTFTYDLRSEAEMVIKEPFAIVELFDAD